jgi:hypothetical protein
MESTSAKRLKSTALPSITGLEASAPEIAEAKDRRTVGNDSDHVAAIGVVEGTVGIGGNGLHRHGNAWRIGQREIALRRHRLGRHHLQLAGRPWL